MAIAFLIFLIGFLFQFRAIFLSHFNRIPGDFGDPRLNHLILENLHQVIEGAIPLREIFNVPFYYPSIAVGTWTDTLWGAGIFYSLFRTLGLDLWDSYTSWVLLMSVLNYFFAFYALRRQFFFQNLGAATGAYLFAFGLPRLAQIGHVQLFPAFITPLFFGFIFLSLKDFPILKKRELSLAALALVYQIYCGFYLGWFLCLTLILGATLFLFHHKTRKNTLKLFHAEWKFLSGLSLASLMLLLPQLLPFLHSARIFGPRPFSYVRTTYPRILSYFHVGPESIFESFVSKILEADLMSASHEHKMGIGVFTTLFVLLGFYIGNKEKLLATRCAGKLSALLFLISISFFSVSVWGLVYLLFPGGSAIRVVSRIILTLLFLYSIAIATLLQKMSGKLKWGIALLIILEQFCTLPTISKTDAIERIARVQARIPKSCDVFFMIKNGTAQERDELQLDAMWVAHQRKIKTVNGYYGHDPVAWNLSPGNAKNLADWKSIHSFKLAPECVITL